MKLADQSSENEFIYVPKSSAIIMCCSENSWALLVSWKSKIQSARLAFQRISRATIIYALYVCELKMSKRQIHKVLIFPKNNPAKIFKK